MQLMKQNGIQVNNNNSNSAERLSTQQHSPKRAASQARGEEDHCYDIYQSKFHILLLRGRGEDW